MNVYFISFFLFKGYNSVLVGGDNHPAAQSHVMPQYTNNKDQE